MTVEFEIWTWFNYRLYLNKNDYAYLSLTVKHDVAVCAISDSKLSACDNKSTVFAISYKRRAHTRAHNYHAVFTLINKARIMMIMNIEVASCAIVNPKLLPFDWTI